MSNSAVGFSSSDIGLGCNPAPTQRLALEIRSGADVLLDIAIEVQKLALRDAPNQREYDADLARLADLQAQRERERR